MNRKAQLCTHQNLVDEPLNTMSPKTQQQKEVPPKNIPKNMFLYLFLDRNEVRSEHRLRLYVIILGSLKVVPKQTP